MPRCESVKQEPRTGALERCVHPARYIVERSFSGISSVVCGQHRPRPGMAATGIKVSPLGNIGAPEPSITDVAIRSADTPHESRRALFDES